MTFFLQVRSIPSKEQRKGSVQPSSLGERKASRVGKSNGVALHRDVSCHLASARTTEVSIWRSGTVQYFLSSRDFS